MLEEIRLSGLGVIAEAVLPFGPGLTVLTGETGAGKTMVLSALGLLMGGRADSALVRPGAARAVVEGRLRLAPTDPALLRAAEAGAVCDDDGTLLVHRSLTADGRSRCLLGGSSVPVSLLAGIAGELLVVHGQADQHRLAQPSVQRDIVDRFAGQAARTAYAQYRQCYEELQALRRELDELTERARDRALEAETLRHGLARVAALAPEAGEEERLAVQLRRLGHVEGLLRAARVAHSALAGGDVDDPEQRSGARSLVAGAAQTLYAVADDDPALAEVAARLDAVVYALTDVGAELASYADNLAVDPAALAAAQERAAALASLTRVYAPDAAGLLAWATQAEQRVTVLNGDDARRGTLEAHLVALEARLEVTGTALSAVRREAAARLAAGTQAELAALAMPAARVTCSIERAAPTTSGADQLSLLLTAHPGAPARPLGRGASGGELSRIMLAMEVVLAGADSVPTMVFDEVDAGVGGQAAIEVGRRLSLLARSHQVLVVTHLPQVAAFADQHVSVVKGEHGDVTSSDVTVLDGPGRVRELSRMLAGLTDSASAHLHAEELLALAGAARSA